MKVLDFGLAKIRTAAETEAPTADALTQPGDVLGTVPTCRPIRCGVLERRRAQRRLLARRPPLRTPVGPASVRRAERGRDGFADPFRGAPGLAPPAGTWRRRRPRSWAGRSQRARRPGSRTAPRSRRPSKARATTSTSGHGSSRAALPCVPVRARCLRRGARGRGRRRRVDLGSPVPAGLGPGCHPSRVPPCGGRQVGRGVRS